MRVRPYTTGAAAVSRACDKMKRLDVFLLNIGIRFVAPATAGVQKRMLPRIHGIPACAGMTDSYHVAVQFVECSKHQI